MSKVWLVTGSASGLGRDIAKAVLASGDRLLATARDLGAPGRDDLFGAGEADAFAAVSAVVAAPAVPIAAVSDAPAAKSAPDRQDAPATRALDQPAATMASDKPTDGGSKPAAQ